MQFGYGGRLRYRRLETGQEARVAVAPASFRRLLACHTDVNINKFGNTRVRHKYSVTKLSRGTAAELTLLSLPRLWNLIAGDWVTLQLVLCTATSALASE